MEDRIAPSPMSPVGGPPAPPPVDTPGDAKASMDRSGRGAAISAGGLRFAVNTSVGVAFGMEESGAVFGPGRERGLVTGGGAGMDGIWLACGDIERALISVTNRARMLSGGPTEDPRRRTSSPRRRAWNAPDAATHPDNRPSGRHLFGVRCRSTLRPCKLLAIGRRPSCRGARGRDPGVGENHPQAPGADPRPTLLAERFSSNSQAEP